MRAAALANALIIVILVGGGVLAAVYPGLHYRVAQEDGLLEWLTFWGFLAAAFRYFANALDDRRRRGGLPWFAVGLGLFCGLVALEEISWGQRLFGYRPPAYFLEENFQQEFNLHNVMATSWRKIVMLLILAGYGVGSALLGTSPTVKSVFSRWRIVAAPAVLVPSFLAMTLLYAWYPWEYAGEWIEAAMALGFLSAALIGNAPDVGNAAEAPVVNALLTTAACAALTVFGQHFLKPADETLRATALAEIEALAVDFAGPKLHTRCGIHKRLYTFMRDYGQTYLLYGEFADRVRGMAEYDRANYLLDPWNSPYWVRHRCSGDRVAVFVYSFGPNRRRDSSEWELRGDDIGKPLQTGSISH
jgi:hypothetical protein